MPQKSIKPKLRFQTGVHSVKGTISKCYKGLKWTSNFKKIDLSFHKEGNQGPRGQVMAMVSEQKGQVSSLTLRSC